MYKEGRLFRLSAGVVLLGCSISGCSDLNSSSFDPFEGLEWPSTKAGAAAGAVVGGGLGALVGSAAGSAGGGLAIGALAGAVTGGAIGHELEGEERQINEQKAKLDRRDEELAAGRQEITSLRREMDDQFRRNNRPSGASAGFEAYRGSSRAKPVGGDSRAGFAPMPVDETPRARMSDSFVTSPLRQAPEPAKIAAKDVKAGPVMSTENLSVPQVVDTTPVMSPENPSIATLSEAPAAEVRQSEGLPPPKLADMPQVVEEKIVEESANEPEQLSIPIESAAPPRPQAEGSDCEKGAEEAKRAKGAASEADKLFFYRRALRLCPSEAAYHVEIGKVYAAIGRETDAQGEYRRALELDPDNGEARRQLAAADTVQGD